MDELQPTPVTAYDMTDPDNPRQLYIAYTAAGVQPAPLNFPLSGQKFVVFDAPYQNTARYGEVASQDSLFRKEAYLVFDLARTADTLALANRMEIEITPHFPNSDVDTYAFQTQNLFPDLSQQEKESLLDKMKVVPNPYFAFSKYETSFDTPVLKFTHMNEEATIRIFNLAGQLVKTIRKNNNLNEVTWDLRNEAGLKVASGMYIAHVEVPGVGEKILKFAVVQREERIDQF
ncbi:MAG: T9SS type A sorting domain-containing protein [Aliifodinibius sp.]|nr:T9SS type A sorting domain-containing protein [candidate division Zixibacteria bacterium]NIT59538.1 T9SS type A sorting domain-containing protein [Fodinibius sp.]NIW47024.1 T9SS type A sorting domain-containing protein [Gammaproteobacteria bacterium]NIS47551.1 T9SS type A sorting domain-containing protein [candidate division Zixibacteria bacterium]NIU15642.1 T9SS type A sorting domain-containing protein [candidate division Zixibacteria bacterium]